MTGDSRSKLPRQKENSIQEQWHEGAALQFQPPALGRHCQIMKARSICDSGFMPKGKLWTFDGGRREHKRSLLWIHVVAGQQAPKFPKRRTASRQLLPARQGRECQGFKRETLFGCEALAQRQGYPLLGHWQMFRCCMIGFGQGSEESFRASAVLVSLNYSPLQEPCMSFGSRMILLGNSNKLACRLSVQLERNSCSNFARPNTSLDSLAARC